MLLYLTLHTICCLCLLCNSALCPWLCLYPWEMGPATEAISVHVAPQPSTNVPQVPRCPGSYSSSTLLIDVLIRSGATLSLWPLPGLLPAPTCGRSGWSFPVWFPLVTAPVTVLFQGHLHASCLSCHVVSDSGTETVPRHLRTAPSLPWHRVGQVLGGWGMCRGKQNWLGICFSRTLESLVRAPIFRGGAASGQKWWRNTGCLCVPWTSLVCPPSVPLQFRLAARGRAVLAFKCALFSWKPTDFLPTRLLCQRVKTRSRCVALHLCPHHRQTDWHHTPCHPGGPRSFPAVWTQWWLPQGSAWHVFNYSLVFSSVSPCSLIVLSFPKSIYLKFCDQSLKNKIKQDIKMKKKNLRRLECQDHFY